MVVGSLIFLNPYICSQASIDRAGGGSDIPSDMAVPVRGLAWWLVCAAVPLQYSDAASSSNAAVSSARDAVREGHYYGRRPAPTCLTIIGCQVSDSTGVAII